MSLADVLRAGGVDLVEEPDWPRFRRPGSLEAVGVMVHHTAGRKDLAVIKNGRPDLKPPLANVWLAKSGTAHLISDGRCNHAGKGSGWVLQEVKADRAPTGDARQRGLVDDTDGNRWFYGIEVENLGNGHDPYPVAQVEALTRICAALCRWRGWTANRVIAHREWTRRKPDPTLDMRQLRQFVASALVPAVSEEDDMTDAERAQLAAAVKQATEANNRARNVEAWVRLLAKKAGITDAELVAATK